MPGSSERDRHHEVMRLLEDAGRVSVPELAERFGVSVVTIRKDLERLERLRLLRRVRGGAVPAPSPDEGAFELRLNVHVAEKTAIAKEAARMVRDGDAIAVDGSTTCYYLIKELLDRRGLGGGPKRGPPDGGPVAGARPARVVTGGDRGQAAAGVAQQRRLRAVRLQQGRTVRAAPVRRDG